MTGTALRVLTGPDRHERRIHDQDGAYVIEFLGSMMAILVMTLIIVQACLVLLNSILVNHALALASVEASARGGVDTTVVRVLDRHLPGAVRKQCGATGSGGGCLTSSVSSTIVPGKESTTQGEMIALEFKYIQPLPLLKVIGISTGIPVTKKTTVGSQSIKE